MKKCDYGCRKEAKYEMSNGKWCCEKYHVECEGVRKKNKNKNKRNGLL